MDGTGAAKLLEACRARKQRGRYSVILEFPEWPKAKALMPPGMELGTNPKSNKFMVLFDLLELIGVLQFMVEAKQ